jgi:hypothetical protein
VPLTRALQGLLSVSVLTQDLRLYCAALCWLQVDMEYLKNLVLHPCCVALRAG